MLIFLTWESKPGLLRPWYLKPSDHFSVTEDQIHQKHVEEASAYYAHEL